MRYEAIVKEYIPVIAAVIAGIFAIVSAYIAWQLKSSSDKQRELLTRAKEKYEEEKTLYTDTFQLFENAIREVLGREKFTLAEKFSENNARIHLLAPKSVEDQYSETASLLESWSALHAKASPQQTRMGDQTVTVLQAPDPTAQYKEPAKKEYEELQDALHKLVELMRNELERNA
jgi:hypothetical protein